MILVQYSSLLIYSTAGNFGEIVYLAIWHLMCNDRGLSKLPLVSFHCDDWFVG